MTILINDFFPFTTKRKILINLNCLWKAMRIYLIPVYFLKKSTRANIVSIPFFFFLFPSHSIMALFSSVYLSAFFSLLLFRLSIILFHFFSTLYFCLWHCLSYTAPPPPSTLPFSISLSPYYFSSFSLTINIINSDCSSQLVSMCSLPPLSYFLVAYTTYFTVFIISVFISCDPSPMKYYWKCFSQLRI